MKYLYITAIGLIMALFSCQDQKTEEAKIDIESSSPEYIAYQKVQNLEVVKQLQQVATKKNQKISLQLSKDLLNGTNGYYWFMVMQEVGPTKLLKLNVKVRENTYEVTIWDDKTTQDMSPEEYLKKYPIK